MDQSTPKPPDGAAVLEGLKQALDGAARCIDLAKKEAARVDAALRSPPSGSVQFEQALLDNAKKRREQLFLVDLRFEIPPSPPQDILPAAPLSLEETKAPETVSAAPASELTEPLLVISR